MLLNIFCGKLDTFYFKHLEIMMNTYIGNNLLEAFMYTALYSVLGRVMALFHCMVRLDSARLVMARHGTTWFGTARYGTALHRSGRFAFPRQFSTAI